MCVAVWCGTDPRPSAARRRAGGGMVAATAAVLVVLVLLWCLPARSFEPAGKSAKAGRRPAATSRKAQQASSNRNKTLTKDRKVNGGTSWIYECLHKSLFSGWRNMLLIPLRILSVSQTPEGTAFAAPPAPAINSHEDGLTVIRKTCIVQMEMTINAKKLLS